MEHYKIKTPTSYHEHTDQKKTDEIAFWRGGKSGLGLMWYSRISDPGGKLIYAAIERFEIGAIRITCASIDPGPSAITAALSISGVPTDKFILWVFPAQERQADFLKKIIESEHWS